MEQPIAKKPGLMSYEQARASLLAHAQHSASTSSTENKSIETVSLMKASGRILAADVISPINVPGFDNSAMDGYALRFADISGPLPVSQRIPAGTFPSALQVGTAARIFTGAPVPEGADSVIMQEAIQVLSDGTEIQVNQNQSFRVGEAIRRAGEDIGKGQLIVQAGEVLTPARLGLIASVGVAEVTVYSPIKVAIFFTGDELTAPGEVLPAGGIYNSNRFVLRAILESLGCEVIDLGQVPDSLDATRKALREASDLADLIVTSGGVSVGEEDHVKPAVEAEGKLDLWQISMKPGKPLAYGQIKKGTDGRATHFIGLPGNPVSSFVTMLLLGCPFVRCLQGAADRLPLRVKLQAGFNFPKADKRREFLRASVRLDGRLELYRTQSSGALTSMAFSQGLIDNPPDTPIAEGDWVDFLPFDSSGKLCN